MQSFDFWRTNRSDIEAAPVVKENIAIFSYEQNELIYTRLGEREYQHIDLGFPLSTNETIPYQRAVDWYPQSVMRLFDGMRDHIDLGALNIRTKKIMIRGVRYSLQAKRFDTPRLGKICVFTCSQVTSRSQNDSGEWRQKSFDAWFFAPQEPVPPQFLGNAMWAIDIDGMSDDEIVRHYERGVPEGGRSAGDLLQPMMNSRALHARDRRVGRKGHPYAQSFFRVPALGLLISQREHLSST